MGRSMAAIRCSSVDLPEPEGPISATNSPREMVMSTSFSAMTWNSSRTNSLVKLIGFDYGLMTCFYLVWANSLPVFQIRGRIRDDVFAADQAVGNLNSLRCGSSHLYGSSNALPSTHHEYAVVAHRGSGDSDDAASTSDWLSGLVFRNKTRRSRSFPAADNRPDSITFTFTWTVAFWRLASGEISRMTPSYLRSG